MSAVSAAPKARDGSREAPGGRTPCVLCLFAEVYGWEVFRCKMQPMVRCGKGYWGRTTILAVTSGRKDSYQCPDFQHATGEAP